MKIQRTLPPAAAPINLKDILNGLKGIVRGQAEIDRFNSDIKEYFKVDHCFFVSSGKAALTLILSALHELHPSRDQVVIPAYTCYSVPSAVLKAGLKIKLCDINENSLDFDFNQLKQILSEPTILAVIPTHLFGMPADIERIKKLNINKNIAVIEDAAQAMGNEYRTNKLGTISDAGFFSLGRGKAFSTVEGGVILTSNPALSEVLRKKITDSSKYSMIETLKLIAYSIIINIFMRPELFWFPKSLPFLRLGETIFESDFIIKQMSPFQAGLARNWNLSLSFMTHIRKKYAKKWRDYILNLQTDIITNFQNNDSARLRFPLKVSESDLSNRILSLSEKYGQGIMRGYPDSINRIPEIRDVFQNMNYPNATAVAQQLVTLPIHQFVNKKDIVIIKKIVNRALYS